MENDPAKIQLMNSLLFSMPGSPTVYYGDELGMGDNIYLGDRNTVRTPMQWSPDRNGGFSRADPQSLYLPPIMDPVYGASGQRRGAVARRRRCSTGRAAVSPSGRPIKRSAQRIRLRPGNRTISLTCAATGIRRSSAS
jgi:maltose alpha-D-glucosyltransferase/alpha-amylase